MDAIDADVSLYAIYALDESEWEFAAAIRPQCKDANEFGRACRTLAMPVKRRRRSLADATEEREKLEFAWPVSADMTGYLPALVASALDVAPAMAQF